jgi:hypothetical protein
MLMYAVCKAPSVPLVCAQSQMAWTSTSSSYVDFMTLAVSKDVTQSSLSGLKTAVQAESAFQTQLNTRSCKPASKVNSAPVPLQSTDHEPG